MNLTETNGIKPAQKGSGISDSKTGWNREPYEEEIKYD